MKKIKKGVNVRRNPCFTGTCFSTKRKKIEEQRGTKPTPQQTNHHTQDK